MKAIRICTTSIFILVIAIFITAPSQYMQSFVDGLTVWAYNVLPAIFPFMVLTTLTLKLQKDDGKHSLTRILFGIKCDTVFITSLLCGYPIGAKAIADSDADRDAATVMASFCSTAGPIFMIATVGGKLLQNTAAALIIITVQIISAMLNGLLYRSNQKYIAIQANTNNLTAKDLGDTITTSTLAVISVGGLIALFYMLTDMVKSFLPQNLSKSLITAFVIGLFEMTNGIFAICNITNTATATILCSTLLAFGGLCVFAQCYAFLGFKNVKPLQLFKMKLTQSAIATILGYIMTKIFL